MSIRPKKGNKIGGDATTTKTKQKSDVLKILLEHGDIVIMHGRDIHKYYEVSLTFFTNPAH